MSHACVRTCVYRRAFTPQHIMHDTPWHIDVLQHQINEVEGPLPAGPVLDKAHIA
jgi:hypothetical protein